MRIENPERQETELQVAWVRRGEPLPPDVATRLQVRNGLPRYVTWAYTGVRREGQYDAVVATAEGEEIGRAPYEIVP